MTNLALGVKTSSLNERDAVRRALIAGERSGEPQSFDFAEFTRRKLAQHAVRVPNAETRAAMEESRAMMAARQPRFASAQALFDDLEKPA